MPETEPHEASGKRKLVAAPQDIRKPGSDETPTAPDTSPERIYVSKRQPGLFLNGRTVPLTTEREYVLGRDKKTCDIWINDERVSRQHAKIYSIEGRYFIEDMNSLNGVFVNRERIKSSIGLLPGDEIILPPQKLLFILQDSAEPPRAEQRFRPSAKPEGLQSHFTGLLRALRIADLIQLLNATLQTGALVIQDPQRSVGRVHFNKGEIVSASYGDKTAEEAVYSLLRVRDGNFEFVQENLPTPEQTIKRSTMSLLLEGCRLADEAQADGTG